MTEIEKTFGDLGLGESLLSAIAKVGYEVPTPIQAGTIPLCLAGTDVIGQASTGTGKTAAFGLPMIEKIVLSRREVQGLILTPTRELAIQITEALESYGTDSPGLKVLSIYGGQSIGGQLKALSRGVHIVVGTPGRVLDHLRRKSLDLSGVESLVVDEADEMLRMGFIDDVEAIIAQTASTRHTALFSATMSREIDKVARKHLQSPRRVTIESTTALTIDERYMKVRGSEKLEMVDRLLSTQDSRGVLIFAERKVDTEEIATRLSERGHKVEALNGDLSQQQREVVVQRLRDEKIDIVIGTDVAARGLDVDHISMVINFDIPQDFNTYTHRVGRTGRAGRQGVAITLVTKKELGYIRSLQRSLDKTIEEMSQPSLTEVAKANAERQKATLRALLLTPEKIPNETYSLVKELSAEGFHMTQVAAAAALLLAGEQGGVREPMKPLSRDSHVREGTGRKSSRRNSRRNSRQGKKGHRKGNGGNASRRTSSRPNRNGSSDGRSVR